MKETILEAIAEHNNAIQYFAAHSIEKVVEITQLIENTFGSKGRIYLCGNGVFMADHQYVADEFVGKSDGDWSNFLMFVYLQTQITRITARRTLSLPTISLVN